MLTASVIFSQALPTTSLLSFLLCAYKIALGCLPVTSLFSSPSVPAYCLLFFLPILCLLLLLFFLRLCLLLRIFLSYSVPTKLLWAACLWLPFFLPLLCQPTAYFFFSLLCLISLLLYFFYLPTASLLFSFPLCSYKIVLCCLPVSTVLPFHAYCFSSFSFIFKLCAYNACVIFLKLCIPLRFFFPHSAYKIVLCCLRALLACSGTFSDPGGQLQNISRVA